MKMKHLIPEPRDVDPRHKRIRETSKRKWEGSRSWGAEHKLLLPPTPSQPRSAPPSPSSRGAPVPPCGHCARLPGGSGGLENRVGGGTSLGFGRERRQVRQESRGRASDFAGDFQDFQVSLETKTVSLRVSAQLLPSFHQGQV